MQADKAEELRGLLLKAQAGDHTAYEVFLREGALILQAYFRKRLPSAADVEDVMQETLMSIHKARHTYAGDRPLAPWIYAIASNRLIDFFRRYRVRMQQEQMNRPELETAPAATPLETSAQFDAVMQAMDSISETQKRVIELLKLQSLSVKEVAARLEMSESAVKVNAWRGYEAIRKWLKRKS